MCSWTGDLSPILPRKGGGRINKVSPAAGNEPHLRPSDSQTPRSQEGLVSADCFILLPLHIFLPSRRGFNQCLVLMVLHGCAGGPTVHYDT